MTGCASPEFTITTEQDAYKSAQSVLVRGENNRISTRTLMGGTHIDQKGLYIDPYLEKDRQTGATVRLGFNIAHRTSNDYIGSQRMQYGSIKEIVFKTDQGELIALQVTDTAISTAGHANDNFMAKYAQDAYTERGNARITPADLARLANAARVSAKVSGSNQSFVYEEKDVEPAFLENIRKFKEINGL